jgi:hypothetical protein
MVERGGPGDNGRRGVDEHRRVERGRYPLLVHAGTRYRTYGYAARGFPYPGIGLGETAARTAILIHPVHHRNGWLSSIGCLNPASGLVDGGSRVGLADSRRRTIAIIDFMQQAMGDAFPRSGPIPDAVVVVDGEPS